MLSLGRLSPARAAAALLGATRTRVASHSCGPRCNLDPAAAACDAAPVAPAGGRKKAMERQPQKPLAPPGFSRTFYKRQLPSPPAIEFASEQGVCPPARRPPAARPPSAHLPACDSCEQNTRWASSIMPAMGRPLLQLLPPAAEPVRLPLAPCATALLLLPPPRLYGCVSCLVLAGGPDADPCLLLCWCCRQADFYRGPGCWNYGVLLPSD